MFHPQPVHQSLCQHRQVSPPGRSDHAEEDRHLEGTDELGGAPSPSRMGSTRKNNRIAKGVVVAQWLMLGDLFPSEQPYFHVAFAEPMLETRRGNASHYITVE